MELIGVFGNKLFSVNCNVFILERDWGERKTLNYYQGIKYYIMLRTNVVKDCSKLEMVKQNLPSYFVCSWYFG